MNSPGELAMCLSKMVKKLRETIYHINLGAEDMPANAEEFESKAKNLIRLIGFFKVDGVPNK